MGPIAIPPCGGWHGDAIVVVTTPYPGWQQLGPIAPYPGCAVTIVGCNWIQQE